MIEYLDAAWNELTKPGAQFEMTATEVAGIPMRVYAKAPPQMGAFWLATQQFGERDYLVFEDERYTYAEADAIVRSLAHQLRDSYGVQPGDRVAVAMRNYPEWVFSYWATILVGAAVVGMNAWWTPREMSYGLLDSRPKVLIADSERIARVSEVLADIRADIELPIIAVRTEAALPENAVLWDDVVKPDDAPAGYPDATVQPTDDATIFYTSGTTGVPKGAQLTHIGSVHNLMNMGFMPLVNAIALGLAADAGAVDSSALPRQSQTPPVAMAPTPLFHVTAMNCIMHPITAAGGKLVLMYKWDPARALELIERERVEVFSGVPTMSRELIAHPDWDSRDVSSLKGMGGGGAPLQPDLVEKIDRSLKSGAPSVGYGLTETHGIVTANSLALYTARPESVGRPVPVVDVKLIDADGTEVPAGPDAVGELCVRGPIIVSGYLNKPDATADAIRDGWFATGDVARIDSDGYVYIVDRVKDMVLRGGENVYCSEVESAIYEHPDVAEAAVFGIPDERLGERVGAVIVTRDAAAPLDSDTLRAFLGSRIANHKIPEEVWVRPDPLPRNANGKFVKRQLRDEYVGQAEPA